MTVLNPNLEIHELIVIPRNYLSSQTLTVSLRDEQTNLSFTYTPESVTFDFYDLVLISIVMPCIYENGFFEMTIRNNLNEIIYKDRVFCTSQSLNTYSINNGAYDTLNTNNNDYIVL
jgi:hypothetical protein